MRRTWLRPALSVFGLVALLALVVAGWWYASERKYQSDLGRLRSLGYWTWPVSVTPTQGGDNAIQIYRNGREGYMQARTPSGAGPIDLLDHVGPFGWEVTREPGYSSKFKERYGKVLSASEVAADLPAVWSPEFRSDSWSVVSSLQAGLAFAELRESNFDGAIDAYEFLCKINSDLLAAPYAQQYTYGAEGTRYELDVLTALLPTIQNDRVRLEKLNGILDRQEPLPSFESALTGEFAHILGLVSDQKKLRTYLKQEIAKKVKRDSLLSNGLGLRMLTREAAAEISEIVSEAPKDDWRAFDKYWSEVSSQYDSKMNDSALDFILHQELRFRTGAEYAKALAHRRLGKLTTKVMLDRVRGKYPPDVASYGDLAQDPYGADVFRHAFGPGSLLIYSLDYNGEDDGGAVLEPVSDGRPARKSLDIVVQIPLSPQ